MNAAGLGKQEALPLWPKNCPSFQLLTDTALVGERASSCLQVTECSELRPPDTGQVQDRLVWKDPGGLRRACPSGGAPPHGAFPLRGGPLRA